MFGGGPYPPLYIQRDRVTWKVLAEYSWSPTTTQSGSFLCTAASSMPIRVVTKEVRYIHELSLTLEHSMSISSPAAPGLTPPLLFIGGSHRGVRCRAVAHSLGTDFLDKWEVPRIIGKSVVLTLARTTEPVN